ncbi:cell division cycle protein 123 [Paracoccidioides brasiliensis Pb18]|uniref:Cell division cycle protein 123 n=1 Tax=Paracoccidioides brasiliensis (strain Pb18) TaxID=502780 RepID=C1GCQ1_PARBD|nr:cell division cycle protein 123 [Paracoccidioides brasiliensis Pb18]EEH48694.1 cell division cycle protein 123 [Paracoccidioides brasiliensis Pb18]ODH52633.1 cell division cycle protein 123 [Paracoccidioides brasiliensis]
MLSTEPDSTIARSNDDETPLQIISKDLPFPPLTRSHVLHCSYHFWHPKYRAVTPKARLIPLTDAFIDYLRTDGIMLPPQDDRSVITDDDSGVYSVSDGSDSDDEEVDPAAEWQEIHAQIKATIAELDGKVAPKLNWSAPKDATWISATNDMQCRTPNDIYLLLKSSDFITHDLEHAFDGCVSEEEQQKQQEKTEITTQPGAQDSPPRIPYHLVLRKYVTLNPALEFRCFVRDRKLLCLCQRDLNHFDFLFGLRDNLRDKIQTFFDIRLHDTFPDRDFVFDVYVPPPHNRVWLMDINPWAPRTDPLLFSWLEILQMKGPGCEAEDKEGVPEEEVVRLALRQRDSRNEEGKGNGRSKLESGNKEEEEEKEANGEGDEVDGEEDEDDIDDTTSLPFVPEFRLVERDDPEAYGFMTPRYSAHKLPREVVDASRSGPGGMGEFLGQWQDILAKKIREDDAAAAAEGA